MERKYDLDERCVVFSAAVLVYVDRMPKTEAGRHMGRQLLRSGTSAALHYGEVQGAESQADFIHKMRIAEQPSGPVYGEVDGRERKGCCVVTAGMRGTRCHFRHKREDRRAQSPTKALMC